jgi:TatD DNase family protein
MLVDTHCHLNLAGHFPDPASELEFALAQGVDRVIVVGIDLETSRIAVELAERFPGVYATVGIHPNSAAELVEGWEDRISEMLAHPKVVAIGEIGLDYHWDLATKEQQYATLEIQLDISEKHDCPVVFHCREAYDELLSVLKKRRTGRWLLHCFSGTSADADRAMRLGCYFGVDGPITYKSAGELREIVAKLPLDRVVVETDSPYLTPVPFRGKPNRPGYVTYVNGMLAAVWRTDAETMAARTTENAERFFERLALPKH